LNGSPSLRRTATVANRVPCLELSVILTFEGVTVTTNSVAGFFLAASADPKQPEIIAIETTAITKRLDCRELSNRLIPTTCSTDAASTLLCIRKAPPTATYSLARRDVVRGRAIELEVVVSGTAISKRRRGSLTTIATRDSVHDGR